ncbi:MAG: CCA tRNA nucleotidyltransferase [Candidatus Micrarchaeota archaeon]
MLEKVLKKIKPSEAESKKIERIANSIIKEINDIGYEAELVGSVARDTYVAGDKDIDIFVFFPESTSREELEKKGTAVGITVLADYKPKMHYAEHPYVKATIEDVDIDVVPCYRVKDKIISAVDRSPLHNKYIKKKLTEQKQRDEVRLLKQFMKAGDIYGADQRVNGFSGYLCELFILKYGSFSKLAEAAAKEWNKKILIDIEQIGKGDDKFIEPLVVIDPVDKDRNVAAAVSRTVLSKFILRCRKYLEKPNKDFFEPKKNKVDVKEMLEGRKMLIVSFAYPKDVNEEIVWSQLEKLAKMIKIQLQDREFLVYRSMYWTDEKDECALAFELNTLELSRYTKHRGPEVWDNENTKAFIEKNPMYWPSRSVICAWKERELSKAADVIEKVLKSGSVPSHLKKEIMKKYKIRDTDKAHKEKELMEKYFDFSV